ncbi:flavin-dependent oxidoreductase [Aminobacter aminovorans]|uniref:flavin-dependent oxidoreductase n=1 Tax=Aminobacter aminovorans TaxID=83263 RepID=UPI00285A8186|nr:flavin-dependent oxidoreductase [Aminobacter aminovorans]MDR7221217.1 2-polyprenyl-6-methoxyphenol hydroxylase-like FAD-dependent oxidoreductase [Aminobacter aminovorans]
MDVMIIGAGIGGLTLALMLHKADVPFRVYESAQEIRPIGVGISILPHASRELTELGLQDALAEVAVTARESCFFNRFGQLIYKEPVGTFAGYDYPQFQIHRGDLQQILYAALVERAGPDCVVTGWKCIDVEQTADATVARFVDGRTGEDRPVQHGAGIVGCDGIHSVVRRKLVPDDGGPIYSGVNMWRGTTWWKPFLGGASYVRAGWLTHGKMVIYPIRNKLDADGRQLINWVAEIETPDYHQQDWNRRGRLDDFIHAFADWSFDFLDVPGLIRGAEAILEYPMVDKDPLARWSFGRITLLGDAAHPMYPRGSNGAGQAILDARALADSFGAGGDVVGVLKSYEDKRLQATATVVRTNRTTPPDVILKEVYERTGDRPFARLDDVITQDELAALLNSYKKVAGYDKATVAERRRA